MSKIRIILISLIALFGVILGFLTYNTFFNKTPQIEAKTIKTDFLNKNKDINIIKDLKINDDLSVSEKDEKLLIDTFTDKVKAKKIGISGKFRNSEVEIEGKYTMLYAYLNNRYKLVDIKPVDLKNRKYIPIGHVSTQSILKDLRNIKVGDFKKGYVGREKYTTLKVDARNTNLDMGKDDIEAEITVKNAFAKTSFKAKLKYYFKKDSWVLVKSAFDDKDNYTVDFITDNLPKTPDENGIINLLTDPKNQNTYMTNKSFTKKVYVSKPKTRTLDNTLIYEYIFVATYEHIGDIEYKVNVPYEYSDGQWVKKPVTIEFNKALLTEMVSKFGNGFSKDKKTAKELFCFYKSDNNTLEGYYIKDNKKELVRAVINVDLKDNNWTLLVVPIGIEDGLKSIFEIQNVSLNLKDKTIVGDGRNFEPKLKVTEQEINDFNNKEGDKLRATEKNTETNKETVSGEHVNSEKNKVNEDKKD